MGWVYHPSRQHGRRVWRVEGGGRRRDGERVGGAYIRGRDRGRDIPRSTHAHTREREREKETQSCEMNCAVSVDTRPCCSHLSPLFTRVCGYWYTGRVPAAIITVGFVETIVCHSKLGGRFLSLWCSARQILEAHPQHQQLQQPSQDRPLPVPPAPSARRRSWR